jgi:hypothetical protein
MGKNLTIMVQQIREAKGEPVLVTSLARRTFASNGTLTDTLQPWADGERILSEPNLELQTELLDRDQADLSAARNYFT